jgi:hypothetical protein
LAGSAAVSAKQNTAIAGKVAAVLLRTAIISRSLVLKMQFIRN